MVQLIRQACKRGASSLNQLIRRTFQRCARPINQLIRKIKRKTTERLRRRKSRKCTTYSPLISDANDCMAAATFSVNDVSGNGCDQAVISTDDVTGNGFDQTLISSNDVMGKNIDDVTDSGFDQTVFSADEVMGNYCIAEGQEASTIDVIERNNNYVIESDHCAAALEVLAAAPEWRNQLVTAVRHDGNVTEGGVSIGSNANFIDTVRHHGNVAEGGISVGSGANSIDQSGWRNQLTTATATTVRQSGNVVTVGSGTVHIDGPVTKELLYQKLKELRPPIEIKRRPSLAHRRCWTPLE